MRLRWIAAVGWTVLIFVACWTPKEVVREAGRESRFLGIPHFDKLVHLSVFVAFAFLWLAASRRPRYAAVAIAGLALAVVTELGQLIPWVNRDAGMDDGAVDLIGVLVGMTLFRYVASRYARKTDAASEPVATGYEAA
jgi:VanZ family protein